MTRRLLTWLFPEPEPCRCGCRNIWTVYVGGGYEGLLPFWVRMKCPACGRQTKKKLFRSRAIREWNKRRRYL
ncbi:MAG: hypothetical protein ACI3VA_12605 [Candidatus Limivicinus sp.]